MIWDRKSSKFLISPSIVLKTFSRINLYITPKFFKICHITKQNCFSLFRYNNKKGDRSAIRISRIVSESVRLGMEDVRWFVMGDDDTVFVLENLIRVLEKYDYKEFYYIGSSSESHLQNILFSYNMAYGGGGFAISYSLAKALEGMQDGCIEKYSDLYGSDDRIQACMAELGVPLTKEIGFHQVSLSKLFFLSKYLCYHIHFIIYFLSLSVVSHSYVFLSSILYIFIYNYFLLK